MIQDSRVHGSTPIRHCIAFVELVQQAFVLQNKGLQKVSKVQDKYYYNTDSVIGSESERTNSVHYS
jgi:hypothetical protein